MKYFPKLIYIKPSQSLANKLLFFSDVFRGWRKGALRTNGFKHSIYALCVRAKKNNFPMDDKVSTKTF